MKRYSLRARVIIYTLLPVLVTGLFFGGFYLFNRVTRIDTDMVEYGTGVIEPLSQSIEEAFLNDDFDSVRRTITYVQSKNARIIESISVYTAEGDLFATTNYKSTFSEVDELNKRPLTIETEVLYGRSAIMIRSPIFNEMAITHGSHRAVDETEPHWPVSRKNNVQKDPLRPGIVGFVTIRFNTDDEALSVYGDTALTLFVILVGLVVTLIFSNNLINDVVDPIDRMVSAIYHLKEGKLETRVLGTMYGELDYLKNGINSMARSIAAYHNEMQQSIDTATKEYKDTLEELEQRNVELELARKRTQDASKLKTEYFANMSHELRTPLNGIIGYVEVLKKSRLTPAQLEYIDTIDGSAHNLLEIINSLLDYTRLESGKIEIQRFPFSLRETAEKTVQFLSQTAHRKGVEVSLDIDQKLPPLLVGDALHLNRIITNLVGNAIKFTEHGSVNVLIKVAGSNDQPVKTSGTVQIEFSIRDTGIGISASQQKKLFKPFVQADSSISRTFGGTGLGLAMTQRLAELMGGGIKVVSAIGRGSEFAMTLPFEVSTMPIEENPILARLVGLNVLLIDGNEWSRKSVSSMLGGWGMTVFAVPDADSVDTLPKQNYDIAFVSAPASEALDFVGSVAAALPEGVPVASLSCHLDESGLHYMDVLGAFCSLVKPVSESDMLAKCMVPFVAALTGEILQKPKKKMRPTSPFQMGQSIAADGASDAQTNQMEKETKPFSLSALAVDDNPVNLKLIAMLLGGLTKEVETSTGGADAIQLCRGRKYDIVFMDIQMPNIDGIEAMETIKKDPSGLNHDTPIVAVTALAMPEERARLLDLGMSGYVAKPIAEEHLRNALENVVNEPNASVTVAAEIDAQGIMDELFTGASVNIRNAELALRNAAGKKELAREMLEMFLTDTEPVQSAIGDLASSTPDKMIKLVHKLAGGAAYCGMPGLQKLCNSVESALRKGNTLASVEPELFEIDDLLGRVKQESPRWLGELKQS